MEFKTFSDRLKANFEKMIASSDCLFEVDADKDEIWNTYLDSYPAGTNDVFRERREHDCSMCKNFVRNIGKAVVITEQNKLRSVWDFDAGNEVYQTVIDKMDEYIKSQPVCDVYHSKETKIGTAENHEQTESGEILTWHHFNVTLPNRFVSNDSEGMFKSKYRDNRTVLQTSLETISEDSLQTVLELIASNSLYKGNEWDSVLNTFLDLKNTYQQLPDSAVNNWLWETSYRVGPVISKIKNHSIGVLLQNIAEGMELDIAVKKYEAIVAPENYQRPKPIFTKAMLDRAQKDVEELGFIDSLPRRFATVDDITIRDLLYADRNTAQQMGVFEEMAKDIPENPQKYDKVDEIAINDFIENVLPTANEIEVMVEGKHATNFASLIAPVNADSKTMFKWGNNFSWVYNGNMTDSSMKENVKNAGGNVTGDLRFSIQWNDEAEFDQNDLDAHCKEPKGFHIYYRSERSPVTGGNLDVDIIHPKKGVPAVENIVYPDRKHMDEGVYKFFVKNYSYCGGTGGFKAEIEFDGVIHSFEYPHTLRNKEVVEVAQVTIRNGNFSIKEMIPSELQTREVWNITTNQFVPVSAICLSPNYWNGAETGNKHYMFMLKGCKNPDRPNGFFNEYLTNELRDHRKVFEALGSKMRCEDSDEQLSGLGFSATQRNDVVVKVKGQIDRMLKVKF